MDDCELKKRTCSRRGHKGHITKLISSMEEILGRLSSARETDPDAKLLDSDSAVVADHLKQLRLKAEMFKELDNKILDKIEDEDKIEEAVSKQLIYKQCCQRELL